MNPPRPTPLRVPAAAIGGPVFWTEPVFYTEKE